MHIYIWRNLLHKNNNIFLDMHDLYGVRIYPKLVYLTIQFV